MANESPLEGLKQDFLEHIAIACEQSEKTVENYDHYLTRFLTHTGVLSPKGITTRKVRAFRDWLGNVETSKGGVLSVKTQNYHLIALRSFLKYLHTRNKTTLDPKRIELYPVTHVSATPVTAEERTRILQAIEGGDVKTLRDRAILHTLAATSLTVSELCSLNAGLVYTGNRLMVHASNDVTKVVPLTKEACRAIQQWQKVRTDTEEALFVAVGPRAVEGDNRLTPRSVQRIVRYYAIKAGIPKQVTPHSLRYYTQSSSE